MLTSGSQPDTVRRVLDGIGAVAPTADVNPIGVNIDGLQQIAVIETLLALGMVMGLVIGIAAFLVSVTDRAVERRAHITALSLIGARARTLRAVQCAQVVLPLGIGLALALVAGKLAESSYLVTGGGAVFWDSRRPRAARSRCRGRGGGGRARHAPADRPPREPGIDPPRLSAPGHRHGQGFRPSWRRWA